MCDCADKVQAKLTEKYPGVTLAQTLGINNSPRHTLVRIEDGESAGPGKRRMRAPALLALYCPFCGVKYGEVTNVQHHPV